MTTRRSRSLGMLRELGRRVLGRGTIRPPWKQVLEQSEPFIRGHVRPAAGPRVLCATSVGGHAIVRLIDSLVGTALWLRGSDASFLLCDEVLPACEAAMFTSVGDPWDFARDGPQRTLCAGCFEGGSTFYRPLPMPTWNYSQFLSPGAAERAMATASALTLEACYGHRLDGVTTGEHARAGVLRFFGMATFEEEDPALVLAIARRYLAGALVTAEAARTAIAKLRPDVLVAHHGVYVPQGILGSVARQAGVRVVNWAPSYRNVTAIYSHDDTYHHSFMTEPTAMWDRRALSAGEERELMSYLALRRGGKGDWSWVTPDRGENAPVEELGRLRAELGIDGRKPTFGLLTNVLWDAQLYYAGNAFADMLEWLWVTLDFFIARPDLQLIVRIHPHEVKEGNRQPTGPAINRRYQSLPPNIKIVERDSGYSTYALMDLCRAVLIYGTKTGVELAPFGTPIVVAGEAWIRGKGISHDAESRDGYRALLESLPEMGPLPPDRIERAKRYAYHYFFRRMIPLGSLDPGGGFPPNLRVRTLEDIMPGRDRGLDVVCHGIMSGAPFIYEPGARGAA